MTPTRPTRRAGASLPEMIVALTLGLLILHLALVTVERVRSAHRLVTQRGDALASLRLGRSVPRRELRNGRPGRDWRVDADSLALRAFRAVGVVCPGGSSGDDVSVWLRGDRLPEPEKDSVLLVRAAGVVTVAALRAAIPDGRPCGARAPTSTVLTLDRSAPDDLVVVRLFERGSYHLSGSALRYRRGASGRQPLTAEVLATPPTGWTRSAGAAGVTLVPSRRMLRRLDLFLAWTEPE